MEYALILFRQRVKFLFLILFFVLSSKISIFTKIIANRIKNTKMSEQDLSIREILRYDENVVKSLFEHYYVTLVLFAKNYVADIDECKDIVQGIFADLIEKKERFESIDNLKAYFYQTTRNRCLKYLRHENVKEKYSQEVKLNNCESFYFERILDEEVYMQLMSAIDRLPQQCRNVFMLVLENKSNSEIAEELGIGIETVKSHKKAGKKILYKQLKNLIPSLLLSSLMQL